MAGKIEQKEEKIVEKINFDNVNDSKVIKLKSDGNMYVEHKVFAEYLIKRGLATEVKDVKITSEEPTTKVI